MRVLVATLVVMTLTAGCGSTQDGDVLAVAEEFYAAVAAEDGRAACDLLTEAAVDELEQASGSSCAQALLEDVSSTHGDPEAEVFGTMALVRWGSETTFLTRFRHGWQVLAAACQPAKLDLFECKVAGS